MPNDSLPQGWQSQKVEKLSETYAGGTPPRSLSAMFGGDIPWVKSSELNRDEISTTEETLTDFGYKSSSVKWVPANTPLVAMYGATAGVMSWLKIPAVTNQAILAIPPRDNSVDPRWLYWVLKFYADKLIATVQGSGQPNLSKRLVDELKVGKPLLVAEQQKIAHILDTIDNLIALTDRHIAKLKLAKAGLLHDLLTRGIDENGELRDPIKHPEQFEETETVIGRIPKDWKLQSLGAVLSDIEAGKSPSCPDRPAMTGEWGVLKVSAVHPEGFKPEENKVITNSAYINSKYQVRDGDLLITRANTYELVGLACLVENPPNNLLISDKSLRLRPDLSKISNAFMNFVLQMPYVKTQIQNNATGSSAGMKNISQGAIKNLFVALPKKTHEQDLIISTISTYNKDIRTKERRREKLRLLKKGLMTDLLTGRVRVKLDAIEEG